MGCTDLQDLQSAHRRWIEAPLRLDKIERESHRAESIAVGSKSFIEEVKKSLGFKAKGRSIASSNDHYNQPAETHLADLPPIPDSKQSMRIRQSPDRIRLGCRRLVQRHFSGHYP
jgi:hypothetical protein